MVDSEEYVQRIGENYPPPHVIDELKVYVFDVLWFLKSLFLCIMLFRLSRSKVIPMIISIFISQVLPFKVPLMYPCFLVGVYCKQTDFFSKMKLAHVVVFVSLFLFFYHFFEPRHMDSNLRSSAMECLLLHFTPFISEVTARFYRLLVGVIGSLAIISTTKMITQVLENNFKITRFARLGSQTQAVYILHGPIVAFVIAKMIDCRSMNICMYNFLVAPLIALLLLFTCSILINLMKPKYRKCIYGIEN